MAFSAVSAFTEGLPAYEPLAYSSNEFNDPIERMLSDTERAKEDLLFEDGCVVIPVANIYYMAGVPDTEDSVFNVYGTFHRDVYKLDGEVLERNRRYYGAGLYHPEKERRRNLDGDRGRIRPGRHLCGGPGTHRGWKR